VINGAAVILAKAASPRKQFDLEIGPAKRDSFRALPICHNAACIDALPASLARHTPSSSDLARCMHPKHDPRAFNRPPSPGEHRP
jgi:hypothetical protein